MQGCSPEAALEFRAPDMTASAAEIDESQMKNPGFGIYIPQAGWIPKRKRKMSDSFDATRPARPCHLTSATERIAHAISPLSVT